MSNRTLALAFSFFVAALPACATDSSSSDLALDDETEQIYTVDGKSDLPLTQPSGQYVNLDAEAGELVTLTLDPNGTFERAFFITCVEFPCFPISQTGTYKLSKTWTGATYIRFYDEVGYAGRYQYLWEPTTDMLMLRAAGTVDWFAMFKVHPADQCPPPNSIVNCWGGPTCLPPDTYCAL